MSFLSIMLVASAFYFAHGRPDSQSWFEAGAEPAYYGDRQVEEEPGVPAQFSAPITDPKEYQHQLYGFMQGVGKAVDKYMTPLMTKLDVTKQDELKSMGMDRLATYVNYLLSRIQEEENEQDKGADQTHGDSLVLDEMMAHAYGEETPVE